MAKFNVTASFSLSTTIEPEGVVFDGYVPNGISEVIDNSYFSAEEVSVTGGDLALVVEADDEHAAEEIAYEMIGEGGEVEDDRGNTWSVYDVSFDVERIEMDKEEALTIIQRLFERMVSNGTLSSEEREAFDVILRLV